MILLRGRGGAHVTITLDEMGHGTPNIPEMRRIPIPLLLTSGGHHWIPVQTCSLEDPPPLLLTSRDGHRNTYGWQVGCTHPTLMLPCYHPQSLEQGNVFTLVYHSVHEE